MGQEIFFDTLKLGVQGLENLDEHIKRTKITCQFINVLTRIADQTIDAWYFSLNESLKTKQNKRIRVGFSLDRNILIPKVVISQLPTLPDIFTLGLSQNAVLKSFDMNGHFKMTNNPVRQVEVAPYYDLILFNEQGYIGETSKAALYYLIGKQLCTAPLQVGILHSTSRMVILKQKHIENRLLHIDEIELVEQWYISNSLIGFCPASLERN